MKRFVVLFVVLTSILVFCVPWDLVSADQIETGPIETESSVTTPLKEGDALGAFRVEKVAGATEDGVEPGEVLCYRCRYGSSPMVLVFAPKTSDRLMSLVKLVNQVVVNHQDDKMRGIVTFFGDESSKLRKAAEAFSVQLGETEIPIVIAEDAQQGPLGYRLSRSDEITVVIAIDSQVVANITSQTSQIDLNVLTAQVEAMLSHEE